MTRNMQFLIDHKVNKIYQAMGLNHEYALEFLCLNAFEENRTLESGSRYYGNLIIDDVLHYSNGFPLTLVVIG